MSYVLVAPEMVADAAGNLAGIGSAISEANAAAAGSTTGIVAAAQDEVSAAISAAAAAPPAGRAAPVAGRQQRHRRRRFKTSLSKTVATARVVPPAVEAASALKVRTPEATPVPPSTAAAAGPALTAKVPAAPARTALNTD
jgi:hypothetical protein